MHPKKSKGVEESEPLAYGTLLDPRYKAHGFYSESAAICAKEKLLAEVKVSVVVPDQESDRQPQERQVVAQATTTSEDADLWGSFDEVPDEVPEPISIDLVAKEFENYFKEPRLPRKKNATEYNDPLEWWITGSGGKYPNMRNAALKFLVASGTSVPSERIFRYVTVYIFYIEHSLKINNDNYPHSTAGHLVNARRTSLSDSSVSNLLFLRENTKKQVCT